jgi:hypothetical protein
MALEAISRIVERNHPVATVSCNGVVRNLSPEGRSLDGQVGIKPADRW